MGPCGTTFDAHVIITAVFGGLSTLLSVWLAHRRRRADDERRAFEDTVLQTLGLNRDVVDLFRRNHKKGNGR